MLRKSRKKVQYEFFEEDASWERQGAVSAGSVPRGGASDGGHSGGGGGSLVSLGGVAYGSETCIIFI